MLIDLSKYSSLKIGKNVEVDIINNINEYNNKKYKNHYIIGGAYNILFSPNPPPLAMLGDNFSYIKQIKTKMQEQDTLIVGAKTNSLKLFKYCKKNNIKDFEFLFKLPGTIGGLVFMNAGLKDDEICSKIISIKTSKGEIFAKNLNYKYRDSGIKSKFGNCIIYEIVFKLEYGFNKTKVKLYDKLRSNQPKHPSAGSCFKNTKDYFVAKLLDEAGLKGQKIGGMSFSSKHCNFLINNGGGTYGDAICLIALAKKKVKQKFDINIELEIKIV
jgi:UDP-N-acetylmuramate dehydrogenase